MKVHVCDNGKFTITLIKTEKSLQGYKITYLWKKLTKTFSQSQEIWLGMMEKYDLWHKCLEREQLEV